MNTISTIFGAEHAKSGILQKPVFLRGTNRKKDGKDHRYFSVVENQRVAGNKTIQRTVL